MHYPWPMVSVGEEGLISAEPTGPFHNGKAVRNIAILHLMPYVGVAAMGPSSDLSPLVYYPLLTLILGASFLYWVFAWHHNYRFVVAGFRTSTSIAEAYAVQTVDADRWIRAGLGYSFDQGQAGDEILRSQGVGGYLVGLRLGITEAGLALRWFPGQKRLIPWTELSPLEPVAPTDLVRPDSLMRPLTPMAQRLRPMSKFSTRRAPQELFVVRERRALRALDAGGHRWPRPHPPS